MSEEQRWRERFLALFPEAFARARQQLALHPLKAGEPVSWMELGVTANDRVFELLGVAESGLLVIQGARDGQIASPGIYEVPREHVVRASDLLRVVLELGHGHGLCDCHPQPALPVQRQH